MFGGLIADRWIGQRNAVVIGALSMSGGHIAMAFDESFLLALQLLVIGSGFLKGNISAQVGALYPVDDDARRTRGFDELNPKDYETASRLRHPSRANSRGFRATLFQLSREDRRWLGVPDGHCLGLIERTVFGDFGFCQRGAKCPVTPVCERQEKVDVCVQIYVMNEVMPIDKGKPRLCLHKSELARIVDGVVYPDE